METIHSFPPVARADARILILGSMPGIQSLSEQQYYAHPRNAFWKIAGNLFNFAPAMPYQQRLLALMDSGVALWDVMAACSRHSSLDSDIIEHSIVTNDFNRFFLEYQQIGAVFFNGVKAAAAYRKYVVPALQPVHRKPAATLPSTSPANARMTPAEKQLAWAKAINAR
jgi:hypoxanthine-DNA glycosylase